MPISLQWKDDDKRIIVITYEGRWTWDEFQTSAQETNTLMDSVDYDVVLLHNTLNGGVLPPGNIISQGKTAVSALSNNLALIIVVLNSSIIRTFLSIVGGLVPTSRNQKIKTVPTLEEAYRMAEEVLASP